VSLTSMMMGSSPRGEDDEEAEGIAHGRVGVVQYEGGTEQACRSTREKRIPVLFIGNLTGASGGAWWAEIKHRHAVPLPQVCFPWKSVLVSFGSSASVRAATLAWFLTGQRPAALEVNTLTTSHSNVHLQMRIKTLCTTQPILNLIKQDYGSNLIWKIY
jgi:hypothetical protein